jgi:hypothetical protein
MSITAQSSSPIAKWRQGSSGSLPPLPPLPTRGEGDSDDEVVIAETVDEALATHMSAIAKLKQRPSSTRACAPTRVSSSPPFYGGHDGPLRRNASEPSSPSLGEVMDAGSLTRPRRRSTHPTPIGGRSEELYAAIFTRVGTGPGPVGHAVGDLMLKKARVKAIGPEQLHGTTEIGAHGFEGCTNLHTLALPQTVERIGASCCQGCTSLSSVVFEGSSQLTRIDKGAFDGCSSLSSFTAPPSLELIGARAFRNCKKLTEVRLPSGLKGLGSHCFEGCDSLVNIHIQPGANTVFQDRCFTGCRALQHIYAPGVATMRFAGDVLRGAAHVKCRTSVPWKPTSDVQVRWCTPTARAAVLQCMLVGVRLQM